MRPNLQSNESNGGGRPGFVFVSRSSCELDATSPEFVVTTTLLRGGPNTAVYLDEDFVGSDASELVFPHLLLCMGVACQMSVSRLLGCHISNATTEAVVLAELQNQIKG